MVPVISTLRLQFHRDFTLDDATRHVDYFARLGVSHIYASPLLASRSGSPHGYDGIDPGRIDPELGGEAALGRLVERLREQGMGLIMDIVPNHLAVGGSENLWWQDLLRWGQQSRYANFFDVDWKSPDPLLTGKILVPFLGQPYGKAVRSGDLQLHFDEHQLTFQVEYHEHRFPIDPRTYGDILEMASCAPVRDCAEVFRRLATESDPRSGLEAAQDQLQQALALEQGRKALADVLAQFNATQDSGAARLHTLLERQNYRLAWWRTASDDLNWRRFFDVTELGGLRVELPEVFEEVHREVFRLVELGWVDGLRIDHVDGLVDPKGYCHKLRQRLDALAEDRGRIPIYVEKILAADESLHRDWCVDGTTGYEFMNEVSALQHDPSQVEVLRELWRETSGRSDDFHVEERRARVEILRTTLASEFSACGRALLAVARQDLATRDFTLGALKRTLAALIRNFRVYRTYAGPGGRPAQDEPFFRQALADARQELNPPDYIVLEYLDRWLGGEAPESIADETTRALRLKAITRFQQLTSPVAAKAVEDTAGYRSAVLISRNDVGFEPGKLSYSATDFHQSCGDRARYFPQAMVTTATHDHKRGEDVRARLAVLSECAENFAAQVRRWRMAANPLRQNLPGGAAPSPADEMILYQTVIGAWPLELDGEDEAGRAEFLERLLQWHEKALREAKLRSHWLWPDDDYEAACQVFLRGLFETPELRHDLMTAARSLDLAGAVNGLAQTTLRCLSPGVPDLYQGTGYWDLSLVDPDNRRPVDYTIRSRSLDQDSTPAEALPLWRNGEVKQALIARLLNLRRSSPALFLEGSYTPVPVLGPRARNLVAFLRQRENQAVLVVVPRFVSGLLADAAVPLVPAETWAETRLDLGDATTSTVDWRNVLGDGSVRALDHRLNVAELLANFPVGVWRAGRRE